MIELTGSVACPCAEGGECPDRGLPGELPILLVIDVPVGELAQVTPHRLSAVAAAVEEPDRHRTEAGFDTAPQYPAA